MNIWTYGQALLQLGATTVWHLVSTILGAVLVGYITALPGAGGPAPEPSAILAVAVLESFAVYWLITHLRLEGVRLVIAVLLIYHGTKHVMMLTEAAAFLVYWASPPLMSMRDILTLEIYGLITSCLYCPGAVLIVKKGRRPAPRATAVAFEPVSLLPTLLAVSLIYLSCYWLAGAFILIPFAGDAFAPTYGMLEVPWWMPLFQIVRGLVWSLLLLLLVWTASGSLQRLRVGAGGLLAVLGAAQLFYPNTYMNDWLRYAHMVEIVVSMSVFGWISAYILQRRLSMI